MSTTCSRARSPLRWLVLMLSCVMFVGSYYSFDIPAALKKQLGNYLSNPVNYESKYSLLYSVYAAPNVVLPLFGGVIVDSIGIRKCLLLFTVFIAVGQLLVSVGIVWKFWSIMYLGRFVFGVGGESLNVAVNALLAEWFKGQELAFAFGVNLSVARVASILTNIFSPIVFRQHGLEVASWVGFVICMVSVLSVVVLVPIDMMFDDKLENDESETNLLLAPSPSSSLLANKNTNTHTNTNQSKRSYNSINHEEKEEKDDERKEKERDWLGLFSFRPIFWVLIVLTCSVYGSVIPFNNVSSVLLQERDYFQATPTQCQLQQPQHCQSVSNPPLVSCPPACSSSIFAACYQPPLPWNATVDGVNYTPLQANDIDCSKPEWYNNNNNNNNDNSNDICTQQYCESLFAAERKVSFAMSIPYFISVVGSPPLGLLIDVVGQRAYIATAAALLLVLAHLLLAFTPSSTVSAAAVPLVLQGLVYTGIATVVWPAIPIIVEDKQLGVAFGIATCAYNLSCFVVPLLLAAIFTASNNKYIPNVELFFVLLGVCGTVAGVCLCVYDYYHGSALNRSSIPVVVSVAAVVVPEKEEGENQI